MREPLFACLLVMSAGCATATPRYNVLHPPTPPAVPPTAIAFVANGSGDASNLSDNLWEVITNCSLPFRVSLTRWTNYGGAAQDHNGLRIGCELRRRRLSAFGAAQIVFRVQLDGMAEKTAADISKGNFGAPSGVEPE